MAKNRGILVDIWNFLRVRKAWWMAPIILMFLLLGLLILAGQTGVLAPFIYALF
jgi:hypothetical protein